MKMFRIGACHFVFFTLHNKQHDQQRGETQALRQRIEELEGQRITQA